MRIGKTIQKWMEERLNGIDQELAGICMNVLKLLAIEEKLRSLARCVERLSIQMEDNTSQQMKLGSY